MRQQSALADQRRATRRRQCDLQGLARGRGISYLHVCYLIQQRMVGIRHPAQHLGGGRLHADGISSLRVRPEPLSRLAQQPGYLATI